MKNSGISQKILATALELLTEWEKGTATLDSCLEELRNDDIVEKSAVASLLFEYFRHKGFIDELIRKNARKDGVKQDMRLLLACAMTQALFQTGIAAQSAVNIAVDYAKELRGQGGAGFVNAMLRSMLRDPGYDKHNIPKSFPPVLEERWKRQFGDDTANGIIKHYASNPPIAFRLRNEPETDAWDKINPAPLDKIDFIGSFRFYETNNISELFTSRLLENASLYIQDPATSMLFSLLDSPPSGMVLDACAAPGGKTIMMYDLVPDNKNMKLTASDRSAQRIKQMNVNLRRAGIRCRTIQAEAQSMPYSPESFDFILADLPCSNTGVIRRRPDAPWRFSTKRLAELVALQREILESLSVLLRPGGILLYSTCSIENDEDASQIDYFLKHHPDFTELKRRLLLPSEKHDGAFASVLKKI